MKRMSVSLASIALACALGANPIATLAWGHSGHEMINRVAAEKLPADVPAFLRTPQAIAEIATLGPEEDRLKGAGTAWDGDFDEGHFIDLQDDGTVAGVVSLAALPKDMGSYTIALEKAGTTPYRQGYLPYTIIDGFERIRKDFAYWRAYDYLAAHAPSDAEKARLTGECELRETLILRDIGVWGHYVGDGSQPLHTTIHYNGWGNYPNPKNYSTSKHIHAMFESEFVDEHVKIDGVRSHVGAFALSDPQELLPEGAIASMVAAYLEGSAKAVPQLYDIEAAHGFTSGTPAAVTFTTDQVARGASMLRDLIAVAWEDSLNETVGYPEVKVRDVLNGTHPTNEGAAL